MFEYLVKNHERISDPLLFGAVAQGPGCGQEISLYIAIRGIWKTRCFAGTGTDARACDLHNLKHNANLSSMGGEQTSYIEIMRDLLPYQSMRYSQILSTCASAPEPNRTWNRVVSIRIVHVNGS